MPNITKITPYLIDFSGDTLSYPKKISLFGYKINLSGTVENSVPVYNIDEQEYEAFQPTELNDEIQKSYIYSLNNALERLNTTLFSQAETITIENSSGEVSLLGIGVGTKTIPIDFFTYSKTLKTEMWGKISTDISTTDLNIRYKFNNNLIAQTGNITLSGFTDETFKLEIITTSRFISISGDTITQGFFTINQNNSYPLLFSMNESNITGTTIDNSIALPIDITAQFSVADIDNKISSTNCIIKRYN